MFGSEKPQNFPDTFSASQRCSSLSLFSSVCQYIIWNCLLCLLRYIVSSYILITLKFPHSFKCFGGRVNTSHHSIKDCWTWIIQILENCKDLGWVHVLSTWIMSMMTHSFSHSSSWPEERHHHVTNFYKIWHSLSTLY